MGKSKGKKRPVRTQADEWETPQDGQPSFALMNAAPEEPIIAIVVNERFQIDVVKHDDGAVTVMLTDLESQRPQLHRTIGEPDADS